MNQQISNIQFLVRDELKKKIKKGLITQFMKTINKKILKNNEPKKLKSQISA